MKLSLEHERLVRMLQESISLMCKSALSYESELNIEGLLGITLDKQNVFLVNINSKFQQEIRAGKDQQRGQDSEEETVFSGAESISESEQQNLSPSSRKRRRKHKKSRENNKREHSDEEDAVYLSDSPVPKSEFALERSSCEFSSRATDSASTDFRLGAQETSSGGYSSGSVHTPTSVVIKKEVLDCDSDKDLSNFGDMSDSFGFTGSGELGPAGQVPYPVSGPMPGDGSVMQSQGGVQIQPGTSADADPGGSRHHHGMPVMSPGWGRQTEVQVAHRTQPHLGGPAWIPQQIPQQRRRPGPFPCPICNLEYPDKGKLSRHIRSFHEKKGLPCPSCNRCFRDNYNLRLHLKAHQNCATRDLGATSRPSSN